MPAVPHSIPTAAIAGGVVAGIAIALVGATLCLLYTSRRSKRELHEKPRYTAPLVIPKPTMPPLPTKPARVQFAESARPPTKAFLSVPKMRGVPRLPSTVSSMSMYSAASGEPRQLY